MRKLTELEKKLRGTLRKSRVIAPRTLEVIQNEISDTSQTITDMQHNISLAMKELRKRGLIVKSTVLDSHGKPVATERINPALKVQRDAMLAIGSLKRYMTLLQEEEEQAIAKRKQKASPSFTKPVWKRDFNELEN